MRADLNIAGEEYKNAIIDTRWFMDAGVEIILRNEEGFEIETVSTNTDVIPPYRNTWIIDKIYVDALEAAGIVEFTGLTYQGLYEVKVLID